jgi:hypothetical protein
LAIVISAVGVVVAALMPWAADESRATGVTTNYGAGAGGYLLAALAAGTVVCALAGVWKQSASLENVSVVLSSACLATAVVLVLTSIEAANDAAAAHVGGSRTTHEVGAVLGGLASLVLLISSVLIRTSWSRVDRIAATTP